MPRKLGNVPWELTVPEGTRDKMANTLSCDPNGEVTTKTSAHVQELAETGITGTPMALAAHGNEYWEEGEEKGISKGKSAGLMAALSFNREIHYCHLRCIELLESGQFLPLLEELKDLVQMTGKFPTPEEIEVESTRKAIESARKRWAEGNVSA